MGGSPAGGGRGGLCVPLGNGAGYPALVAEAAARAEAASAEARVGRRLRVRVVRRLEDQRRGGHRGGDRRSNQTGLRGGGGGGSSGDGVIVAAAIAAAAVAAAADDLRVRGRAVVGRGVHAVRPAVALARSGRRQHRAAAVAAQRKAAAVRGIQKQQLAGRAAPGQGRVVRAPAERWLVTRRNWILNSCMWCKTSYITSY